MAGVQSRKLTIIGRRGSGKTSLVRRYVLREFKADYLSTLGVDIYTHTLDAAQLGTGSDDLRLLIWDTQGEIDKRIFKHPYFQGTSGVCVVGDVTSPQAMTTMVQLAHICDVEAAGRPCVLLCNKVDLLEPGQEPDWPDGFDRRRWPLFLTSAKADTNVADAFLTVARAIMRRNL